MKNAEKQIIDLLPELDQAGLKRVLEIVFEKLKVNTIDEFGVTPFQWLNMIESVKQYENGELATISRDEMEKIVKFKKRANQMEISLENWKEIENRGN